jgi:hypothetical protein
MKLGTLLLRNAAIGLPQLETALRNQVLYGGKLGTNLVELGFIDLDVLGVYLGEVCGLPVASRLLLDSVPPEILGLVGSELAHDLGAIPLAWLAESPRTLAVAMIEPTSQVLVDVLAGHVGAPVQPYAIAELRAHYYLERHYGRSRSARFVRQGTRLANAPTVAERRRAQPVGGLAMPAAITVAPRARRSSQMPAVAAPPVDVGISVGDALLRLATATHREHVADAFIEFARGRCGALVLFIVRDANALGWRGHVATTIGRHDRIDGLSLPLAGVSILQAAYDDARPARGAEPEPTDLLALPIVVRQRVANLIYAHGLAGGPLGADLVEELSRLADAARDAYVRILDETSGAEG